jgi:hypothetical protein
MPITITATMAATTTKTMRVTRTTRGRTAAVIGAALIAALATGADAGDRGTSERGRKTAAPEATTEKGRTANEERSTKPLRLYGTRWYRDTPAALAAGTKAKKPVLLVRMLGELDEKT